MILLFLERMIFNLYWIVWLDIFSFKLKLTYTHNLNYKLSQFFKILKNDCLTVFDCIFYTCCYNFHCLLNIASCLSALHSTAALQEDCTMCTCVQRYHYSVYIVHQYPTLQTLMQKYTDTDPPLNTPKTDWPQGNRHRLHANLLHWWLDGGLVVYWCLSVCTSVYSFKKSPYFSFNSYLTLNDLMCICV